MVSSTTARAMKSPTTSAAPGVSRDKSGNRSRMRLPSERLWEGKEHTRWQRVHAPKASLYLIFRKNGAIQR
jgi:hypothetical protein